MKYEIHYQPAFAVARVMLDPGKGVRAESGSMVSMSPTIDLQSGLPGGLGRMIGRVLGRETAFQSTFTAMRGAGEVILAPPHIGDVVGIDPQGGAFLVTSGNYLAGDLDLDFETRTSFKGFFAGEGFFMIRVSGHGTLLVSAFGAIHAVELAAGQSYLVDSGHVVAFREGMGFALRKAARSWLGTLTSREGVLAEFTGPGVIYMQTRSPNAFGTYLKSFIEME